MGVFSRLSKRMGKVADDASKKSAKLLEATKLNAEISRLQAKIEDLQFGLGRIYFKNNKTVKTGPYTDIIQEILNCEQEIKYRNIKLLAHKGLKYCSNCDAIIGSNDVFCNKCGTPLQPEQNTRPSNCENCGAVLVGELSHCPECGLKLY